ncbi:MAG TPA: thioesterase family protein [Ignavibacteriaceae bacterium]|nr:thioesterase family protein [Ignavibacteriaceae bacterium]
MLETEFEIRVRYADTDKMQFVYNGKYLEYFEVGRTEMLRKTGFSYRQLEESGYQLPLLDSYVRYVNYAQYDDLLLIKSRLNEIPSVKMKINYQIFRKRDGLLVAEGYTTHAFIRTDTKKATRVPEVFLNIIRKFFND